MIVIPERTQGRRQLVVQTVTIIKTMAVFGRGFLPIVSAKSVFMILKNIGTDGTGTKNKNKP